ncbi:MAG: adenylyl-sulfate reductase subunit alpha [Candidatus Brocadia sp. AMX2]|uniref:Adenylylsulfate reductase chain A n=1 Tax=Candidatus Brocadia sinica JPN1 TaxID=1197129 RepID=A0ABQ0JVL3_9BACT|nr:MULTISPECIES: adenylyl-sulfate reductase subunit alpha [Brocadia]MBC6930779.1 adenylyl-sulfate reductase subunit alpha [Candidatus Brocadia sp.]MBL1167748.1 adenylyl-sulfate reductase subunit alpha [Candidatus Brocadia sp. AMX1]NOG41360.1 adenylyl-sulfate reductase subunit alpha [Planctomycetota bacterium]GIK13684.1 MAG: adenylylsulfate reductase subunit alpha [Candidatus Brocadia sinica]KAA0245581.1 MAG: adenylyl-sulfate reductase subunit alpha [Candidatus Brocadia sp. AMX2]
MSISHIDTDILIIGGGAAGCFAAVEIYKKSPTCNVVVMEKAHIERSGCLSMGLNAINAYLHAGQTPESYVAFIERQFEGIIRKDLVYSIVEGLNEAVKDVEGMGLPVEKNEDGTYKMRGKRSIRIFGERLKPILAEAVQKTSALVLNRVVATNFIYDGNRVCGAFGYGVKNSTFYVIRAKAVIVATGGASGIYKPSNTGEARHLIWYCPWNAGTGYAMGIRIGAEMTSFENRFVALRVKDVNAPTGTIAVGARAKQINARGEDYLERYYKHLGGNKCLTQHRLLATVEEKKMGRGPCYLDTTTMNESDERRLKEDFLNMNPQIILLWASKGMNPRHKPVEIQGTEPFIVGGHCQAGYWIDKERRTTIPGLYAAGEVAGGAPKKYVSGSWVEGRIAATTVMKDIKDVTLKNIDSGVIRGEKTRVLAPLTKKTGTLPLEVRERLQKIMDEYAGGISMNYALHEERLLEARRLLKCLKDRMKDVAAVNNYHLVEALECIDRIDVARVLVEHLIYRKESRWACYQTRLDYPQKDNSRWLTFVNSIYNSTMDEIKMVERPLCS